MLKPLRERARGRWHGILPMLGISKKHLTGRHGACPICGGKDRFRFDDKDGAGTFFCNQCGAGDGVSLVMKYKGVDFKGAAMMIEAHIGDAPVQKARPQLSEREKRAAIDDLARDAQPLKWTDPGGRYLRRRCGDISMPQDLFHISNCKYSGAADTYHPAMLAVIRSAGGKVVNVQRHYLTGDGRKADVPSPVKAMPGDIPVGSAVRLAPVGDNTRMMGIAEGVVTAISAQEYFGDIPVWAALNDWHMTQWRPPRGIAEIVIFGDNDRSFAGAKAAYLLAWELHRLDIRVIVKIPKTRGDDWNDVLMKERMEG